MRGRIWAGLAWMRRSAIDGRAAPNFESHLESALASPSSSALSTKSGPKIRRSHKMARRPRPSPRPVSPIPREGKTSFINRLIIGRRQCALRRSETAIAASTWGASFSIDLNDIMSPYTGVGFNVDGRFNQQENARHGGRQACNDFPDGDLCIREMKPRDHWRRRCPNLLKRLMFCVKTF
jgi:hypothetical protein